jgi:hypothetical protein
MIGFKKKAFEIGNIENCRIDYSVKGADQDYLNQIVYPQVQNSITEHRVIGMPVRHENPYSYSQIENITVDVSNYDEHAKEFFSNPELLDRCNKLVNHVGCGFHIEKHYNDILDRHYEGAIPFWFKYGNKEVCEKLDEIENKYPDVFYWVKK